MAVRAGAAELAALRGCWRRWTAVVELFARRRRGRLRLDPREYARLHQELLEACRAAAGAAGEDGGVFYRGLENLAEPWLTLRVLRQADREILSDLLLRCRQAGQGLGLRPRAGVGRWWPAALALVALPLLGWGAGSSWPRSLGRPRDWPGAVWWAVRHSGPAERLFVGGTLATLAALYLVSRIRRA